MTRPRRLLQILTLRCAAASELVSQSMEEPLPLPERLALAGHLLICGPCRRFRLQIQFLRDACRHNDTGPKTTEPESDGLSAVARSRISRAIRDAKPGEDS